MGVQFSQEDDFQLFQRFHAGDEKAGDEIIQKHMGLVWSYVQLIIQCGAYIDLRADLVQLGIEGLIIARNQFDWNRGNKFCTFACHWIRKFVNEGRDKEMKFRERYEPIDGDCTENDGTQNSVLMNMRLACDDNSLEEVILRSDMKTILTAREFDICCFKEQGQTIAEIGRLFGVTPQRIHQLLDAARPRIQEYFGHN